jgi:hypothetical protein
MNDVVSTMKEGETIDKYTLHVSMSPTFEARSYRTMFAFGNRFHVSNVEEHLTTFDSGMAATFEHECRSRPNDQRPLLAKIGVCRGVEEILELNYGVLKTMVLLCNWVKANYNGSKTTIKRDEYGFTLVDFTSFIPISNQSFAFTIHVEQVFSSKRHKGKKLEGNSMEGSLREMHHKKGSDRSYRS